jgi:glutathione S-transferase
MALTIYGSPRSRTMRVLWLAAELDIEFEHVPYAFDDPALKTPAFLALNPAGAIPTIVDDGFALSESLAINLYLAKKHQRPGAQSLYASSAREEASIWQWSLWAQGHLEPWVQKDLLLADLINAIGDRADAMIYRSLAVLDRALADDDWLVGSRFTVADLNVAGVLSPSRSTALDLTRCPHVADWLQRCYTRPAAVAVRRRFEVIAKP